MTELWLPIPNYEGLYEVSNYGRVRSLDREIPHSRYGIQIRKGCMLRSQIGYGGYIYVQLHKKGNKNTQSVHTLVLTTFVGNRPENCECNHIDGNITNNNVTNLEWVSHQRNIQHAYDIGLSSNKGTNNGGAKLTDKQIRQIRSYKKISNKELSQIFGVSRKTIWSIRNDKSWKHIK